jgi:hypothetical protein
VKPERGLYMVNSKRPKLLSEDQLEGYIAYYGHPISLDNIKLRISSATVFDSPDNIPLPIPVHVNYGVVNNITTERLGYIERVFKDEFGVKIQYKIDNLKYLEKAKEVYLSGMALLTIFCPSKDIIVGKDFVIEKWPISALYLVNIPFRPELN